MLQFALVFLGCVSVALTAVVPTHQAFTQELVDHINNGKNSWTAGWNNHFNGMPLEVVRRTMGVKGLGKARGVAPEINVASIPDTFDSRDKWPACPTIFEIRDQAACGSCWAIAVAEAMSDRICIQNKGDYVHVSAEDLMTCCDECGNGCDGGYPLAAVQFMVDTGIVTGSNYTVNTGCSPYKIPPCDHHLDHPGKYQPCGESQPTPPCEKKCIDGYDKSYSDDKHFGSSAYSVDSSVSKIQKEIMTNGPVVAAFTVYEDFLHYKSGVYQHVSGGIAGGHAVKIIGWGTENSVPYWLVANSWNNDWGLDGFFKMIRGKDEGGFESGICAGLPKSN